MTDDPVRALRGHRSPEDVDLTRQHTNHRKPAAGQRQTRPAPGREELAPWGLGARPPEDTPRDLVRAFRGQASPERGAGGSRTHTGTDLNRVPLPLGYGP